MATQKGMLSFRMPSIRDLNDNAALAAERAALHAVSIITRRTGKGLDVDGRPFKPYGAAYAAKRAAAGRQTSPVNLTLTGTLLRGLRVLRVEPNGRRAWIGWEGQHVTRDVLHAGFSDLTLVRMLGGRALEVDEKGEKFRFDRHGRQTAGRLAEFVKSDREALQSFRLFGSRVIGAKARKFQERANRQARATLRTVSYLDLVGGIERKRAFFAIRSRKERAEIVEVYRRTVRDGLQRRLNARLP